MRTARSSVGAVLGLGLWGLAAWATATTDTTEATETTRQGVFGAVVEVRVVNVEAVVTDADGARVGGLGPDAFRLFVDGKPATIDYFSEISEGGLAPREEVVDHPPPPPSLVAEGPEQRVGTSYLLFIDDFFPLKSDRDRALRQLADHVTALGPHDRMAVVAFDGEGLSKLSDWTGDHARLQATLTEAQSRDTGGATRRFELATVESDVELKQYVKELKGQTVSAVAAASSALRSVPVPQGRKVMILLSGGWALDPSKLLPMDDRRYLTRRGLEGGPEIIRPLSDIANLLGYTIYPVDVPGFRPVAGGPAEDRGFDLDLDTFPQRPMPAGEAPPATVQAEAPEELAAPEARADQRALEDQYSLQMMAEETGGRATLNAALDGVFDDTRTYYWLGFTPTVRGDDQRHEIRLEMVRPGLKVRTRQSFVDFSLERHTTMRVEGALMSGATPGTPALEVKVGETQSAPKKMILVPLEITIPTDQVSVVETADGFEIRLELRAAAIDDWGRPSEIPIIPVVFTSAHPPAPGGHATYRTTIQLRQAHHDVLVTVYDPRLDQLLAKRISLDL